MNRAEYVRIVVNIVKTTAFISGTLYLRLYTKGICVRGETPHMVMETRWTDISARMLATSRIPVPGRGGPALFFPHTLFFLLLCHCCVESAHGGG